MKSSTKDNVQGKLHQVCGTIKQAVGKATRDASLETEGKIENLEGRIQEKVGEIKKVAGK